MDDQKILMHIAYNGARYCGWQNQPNAISIQQLIEQALTTILRKPVSIVGASRTDAGVHACGQMAHFFCPAAISLPRLLSSLNGLLPQDIRIISLNAVHEDFHARYSAISKEYHYHLWLERICDPFHYPYRHHLSDSRFDANLLCESAIFFVGKHDFASFANSGSQVKTTTRTLYRLDVVPQDGGVRLEFEGDGFLYKMVRNIVGTLLEVAVGKRKLGSIPELFARHERQFAGVAAPAKGLFLMKVNYIADRVEKMTFSPARKPRD